jgi:hypothetical protein
MELTYTFSATLWEAPGEAPWVFVTLPEAVSDEILDEIPRRPGFGSVKVTALVGATKWSTSLFPSKELRSYVLPVKRAIRAGEGLDVGDVARITVEIDIGGER